MIPYDDLVAALASWRQRQGLPTGQLPGAGSGAIAAKPAAAAAAPAARPAAVVVDASHDDSLDVDDAALLEESSYDSGFGAFDSEPAEATAIGGAPTPQAPFGGGDSGGVSRPPPPRRGR